MRTKVNVGVDRDILLSVVIPVYNEGSVIVKTLREINVVLSNMKIKYEIVVVDDGSTDSTKALLKENSDVILISRETNRGYGFSIKEGIKKARSEWILIIDADGSYPVECILSLVGESSKYDMIIGERTGENVHFGPFNSIGKLILRILVYALTSQWIKDMNSGLRLFKKGVALKYWGLIPDGFSLTTTLTIGSIIEGCKVKFVSIDYLKRVGKSKIRPLRDFGNFVLLVFRIVSFFRPLRFFLPISGFFLIVTGLRCVRDIMLDNRIGSAAILLFFISIQAFFFGLLADLIVTKDKGDNL